jgi:twitching motility protein PilT
MNIEELLHLMVRERASDLHLKVPSPPVLRIDGELVRQGDLANVTPESAREALESITTESQRKEFYETLELDFAYGIVGLARFRVSAFFQRGTISVAIRNLPLKVPTIADLGLPPICETLAMKRRGLVLVTGPTGSGKSTTLAAMIDHLNNNSRRHIITMEDPIEYVHSDAQCLIAQRDLGDDTKSFASALRYSLRQDPDVILVGEMRDLDTIAAAITAAETGHLVLSTVHANNAPQTVERLIDVFPANQQQQIRFGLSQVLEGVLSQILLRRAEGRGRVAAFEVMVCTDAIRSLIREGKTDQIASYLQTGRQHGMQTMEQALQDLFGEGLAIKDAPPEEGRVPDVMRSGSPASARSQIARRN